MRKITDKMFNEIEKRLEHNGIAQYYVKSKNSRGLLVQTAGCLVGVKEKTGNNDGEWVQEIQKTVDGKATNEAWCACFVNTCIAYVERKLGIVSRFPNSEHCVTTWNKAIELGMKVKNVPLPGAIAIWRHNGTSNGHTEILLEFGNDKYFPAIGGNTAGSIVPITEADMEVVREGNSVGYTYRYKGTVGTMKLLGYLKPF